MSYSICPASQEDATDVLDNCYPEEKVIHQQYVPWTSFKGSNLEAIKNDKDCYTLKNPDGEAIALFGIRPGEFNLMWCMPKANLSMRDNVAFLRRGRQVVQEWYKEFGTLYVPVHDSWSEVKDLVMFMGFKIIEEDNIGIYGDEK